MRHLTWAQLATELDSAGLPRTLAGIATLQRTDEMGALEWLQSHGDDELRETAEVLGDPSAMADLHEADIERAAGISGVPITTFFSARSLDLCAIARDGRNGA